MLNKKVKILVSTMALSGAICSAMLPTLTYAKNQNTNNIIESKELDSNNKESPIGNARTSVITEEKELKKMADEHNIPLEKDGKKISRIETEFVPMATKEENTK